MKNRKNIIYLLIYLTIIFCLAPITVVVANNDLKTVSTDNKVVPSPYFKKGIYINYAIEDKHPSKDFFYIFYDEKSGHTDDGSVGMGLPFACEQMEGVVKFSFGGADPENEELLTIEQIKNGCVIGYFKDKKKLIFIPVPNVNPDKFDAQKYLKKAERKKVRFRKFK